MMFTPELIFGNALDYFLLYSNILISFSFHRSTLHWCHWLPGRSVCRLHCTTILKSDSFRLNFHPTPPLVPLISQFKIITWFVVVLPCSVLIFAQCSYLKAGAETTGSSVFLSLLQQIMRFIFEINGLS